MPALAMIGDHLPLWGYIGSLVVANAAVGSTFPGDHGGRAEHGRAPPDGYRHGG
ncbi:MAG: hypothetical protein WDN06_13295 [Asticcacaulis sp.]